jgi:hypothetical protein
MHFFLLLRTHRAIDFLIIQVGFERAGLLTCAGFSSPLPGVNQWDYERIKTPTVAGAVTELASPHRVPYYFSEKFT